jgi:hypothetical protein
MPSVVSLTSFLAYPKSTKTILTPLVPNFHNLPPASNHVTAYYKKKQQPTQRLICSSVAGRIKADLPPSISLLT